MPSASAPSSADGYKLLQKKMKKVDKFLEKLKVKPGQEQKKKYRAYQQKKKEYQKRLEKTREYKEKKLNNALDDLHNMSMHSVDLSVDLSVDIDIMEDEDEDDDDDEDDDEDDDDDDDADSSSSGSSSSSSSSDDSIDYPLILRKYDKVARILKDLEKQHGSGDDDKDNDKNDKDKDKDKNNDKNDKDKDKKDKDKKKDKKKKDKDKKKNAVGGGGGGVKNRKDYKKYVAKQKEYLQDLERTKEWPPELRARKMRRQVHEAEAERERDRDRRVAEAEAEHARLVQNAREFQQAELAIAKELALLKLRKTAAKHDEQAKAQEVAYALAERAADDAFRKQFNADELEHEAQKRAEEHYHSLQEQEDIGLIKIIHK